MAPGARTIENGSRSYIAPSRNEISKSRRMVGNASVNTLANSGAAIMTNPYQEQPRVQGSRRMASNRAMNTTDPTS